MHFLNRWRRKSWAANSMKKPPLGMTARCKVARVVDGDTVDVELLINTRVRLLDCWAPETRTVDAEEKKRGLAAKVHLEEVVGGETGIVFIPTEQAHSTSDVITMSRILGRIWMDGQDFDLSSQQVRQGYAASFKGGELGR